MAKKHVRISAASPGDGREIPRVHVFRMVLKGTAAGNTRRAFYVGR